MTNLRTWGLQFVVSAIVLTLFFAVIVGKRGLNLAVFVVVLSMIGPTIYWLRSRTRDRIDS